MASPQDYHWLKETLINSGNIVDFEEYDLGHLGLLFPADVNTSTVGIMNRIIDL